MGIKRTVRPPGHLCVRTGSPEALPHRRTPPPPCTAPGCPCRSVTLPCARPVARRSPEPAQPAKAESEAEARQQEEARLPTPSQELLGQRGQLQAARKEAARWRTAAAV